MAQRHGGGSGHTLWVRRCGSLQLHQLPPPARSLARLRRRQLSKGLAVQAPAGGRQRSGSSQLAALRAARSSPPAPTLHSD